jgi:transposase
MILWDHSVDVYLHRDPVDFRKAINGLSLIVSEVMELSPFDRALFVFCNRQHSQLKVLYWDQTGFALWQKRLEKDKFQWPRRYTDECVHITHEQWLWLLRGFDITRLQSHSPLSFASVS